MDSIIESMTINQILKKLAFSDRDKQIFLEQRSGKASLSELAKDYGISKGRVNAIIQNVQKNFSKHYNRIGD